MLEFVEVQMARNSPDLWTCVVDSTEISPHLHAAKLPLPTAPHISLASVRTRRTQLGRYLAPTEFFCSNPS